jgi:hypothetical protein
MFDLSANPDFKNVEDAKIVNPYYDINGDKMGTNIDIYGSDALDQAIEMVLCTEPYERLFNISLSSPLYQILFQNSTNIDAIMTSIFDQIEYWVPVVVDRANAEVEQLTSEHAIKFKIPYISNNGRIAHIFNRIIGR